MAVTTTSSLSQEMSTFYDKRFLERARLLTRYDYGAVKKYVSRNSGKTVNFTRMTPLALATTALTEGTTPTEANAASVTVPATLSVYGSHIKVSDLFEMTSIDENLAEKVDLIAQNAAESLDELIRIELAANATSQFANNRATLITVAAGDVLTGLEVRKAVKTLRVNKAPLFEDGFYRGMIPATSVYNLQGNTEWLDAYRYTDATNIQSGEIGRLHGVKFVMTNNEDKQTGAGAAGIDVYGTFICGKGAYGTVNLEGQEGSRVIVKNPGEQDTSNPLNVFSTIGWKALFTSKVLNASWVIRIQAAGQ